MISCLVVNMDNMVICMCRRVTRTLLLLVIGWIHNGVSHGGRMNGNMDIGQNMNHSMTGIKHGMTPTHMFKMNPKTLR